MHVGFKSVELAGEISSCLCGQTEKDVTMEFPFMIQMLGTPCQVSNTKQEPTATMSSKRAKTKTTKKRPQRATSNVFAMFDQSQIQEFKEAFNMIDQNRDGFIDKEDLHDMLASLGKNPTDEYLDAMMNEAPGPINFTMFLTMFGEKLNGTDPEDVIRNAFACFDEEATGGRNNSVHVFFLLTSVTINVYAHGSGDQFFKSENFSFCKLKIMPVFSCAKFAFLVSVEISNIWEFVLLSKTGESIKGIDWEPGS
uniref:EF-hand domain-containing protein n=1 Tax=Zosterops lateralis melanops TaxID=1220523 RepID=A0A8D2PEQ7_ZOSLA